MTAIWLAVVAPMISQTLAVADTPAMTMGMDCDGPHDHAPPLAPHPSSMEKCGYCGLLSHQPVLLAASLPAALNQPPAGLPVAYRAPLSAEPSVLAAAPRGPPVFPQR
ncbi:DUF2946 family protein [Dyella jiangningensis]|uniref:DUF2946 domain-containing protein n=1 Tax=Dyella jiangningensis TaxID=1379159 RepID=A0A328P6H5_9GAMM|nr:DUF2946 family protein [Dyella jiangningensis]RAO76943.1 hypothetical protein CA260_03265 [Dyella jiangningensis]